MNRINRDEGHGSIEMFKPGKINDGQRIANEYTCSRELYVPISRHKNIIIYFYEGLI